MKVFINLHSNVVDKIALITYYIYNGQRCSPMMKIIHE